MNLYKKGAKKGEVNLTCQGRPGMSRRRPAKQIASNVPVETSAELMDMGSTEDLQAFIDEQPEEPRARLPVPPAWELADVVAKLKEVFGFDRFRCDVQQATVQSVLRLHSCLSIMRTGVGKSLCYQLPAALLPGLVLVVTPLISLMKDQLFRIPPQLPAAAIYNQLTKSEVQRTVTMLKSGQLKILFVSPEKCASVDFIQLTRQIPPISVACVDEAHCLTEWSHNFRSAYIGIGDLLYDKIGAACVLALTATATRRVEREICSALRIQPSLCLRERDVLRSNIHLSASLSHFKESDLLALLKSDPHYSHGSSIIVYCSRKERCEEVARRLRSEGFSAEPYHAGLPASVRTTTQNGFMSGKIKIVCATVAFGMGLNKDDVRNVIHYDMPQSIEAYIQQIGRSGRDGQASFCHTLLDEETYFRAHSLAHSDMPEFDSLKQFLVDLFAGPYSILSAADDESNSGLPPNVTDTLLGQLQSRGLLQRLRPWYTTIQYNFHRTDPEELRKTNPFVDSLLASSRKVPKAWIGNLRTLCRKTGNPPSELSEKLEHLKTVGEISYELKVQGHCVAVPEPLDNVHAMALELLEQFRVLEMAQCWRLNRAYALFRAHAAPTSTAPEILSERDRGLRAGLEAYFTQDEEPTRESSTANEFYEPDKLKQLTSFVRTDIRLFISKHGDQVATPRALARIFHGMNSAKHPRQAWFGIACDWHTYDFNEIIAIGTEMFMKRGRS